MTGEGTATFSTLDPDATTPPALETTQANWRVVRAWDQKPSTASFPWNLFATQIGALTLPNVTGRLAAVASEGFGSWQVSLFGYDADGRVSARHTYTHRFWTTTVEPALSTTVTYARDLRGEVTERHVTLGTNAWHEWQDHDGRGLLWKVYASTTSMKPAAPDVTYTYRPSGAVEGVQYAGGPLVGRRYTIREELERIGDPAQTTYPFSARYAYNTNGTLSEAEFYNQGTPASAKRYRYLYTGYDALNRLLGADHSSWNGSSWTSTLAHDVSGLAYDRSGNLTALKRHRENATLVDDLTYAYQGAGSRLTSVTDAVGTTAETWDAESGTFTYDANGNVRIAPAPFAMTNATYDGRNRLIWVDQAGAGTTYRYDEDGWRIAKNRPGFPVEYYVREGPLVLAEVKVDGSGNVSALHFNVVAGAQVVGRQPSAGSRLYYHVDMLGSVRSVVAGTTVMESYDYDPWGVRMPGRTLGSGTKEGFTGKERDAGTELDYFGARYYMSALGRWASVDPVADSFPEWSVYNYVLDDPARLTDPDGRNPCLIYPQACAAVALIAGSAIGSGVGQVVTNWQQGESLWQGVGAATLSGASQGATGSLLLVGGEALATRWAARAAAGSAPRTGAAVLSARADAARGAAHGLEARPDVVLSGGRSGQLVKTLMGPPSSAVRGGPGRVFVTNEKGQVILDITSSRVKAVTPGQGFGPKRPPTSEEFDLLSKILGGGQ